MELLKPMSHATRKNIGVIGLGIIGRGVAGALRRKGFPVYVWNRSPRSIPNFVGSPGEVAEICNSIQIFVSDDDALLQTAQQLLRIQCVPRLKLSSVARRGLSRRHLQEVKLQPKRANSFIMCAGTMRHCAKRVRSLKPAVKRSSRSDRQLARRAPSRSQPT